MVPVHITSGCGIDILSLLIPRWEWGWWSSSGRTGRDGPFPGEYGEMIIPHVSEWKLNDTHARICNSHLFRISVIVNQFRKPWNS